MIAAFLLAVLGSVFLAVLFQESEREKQIEIILSRQMTVLAGYGLYAITSLASATGFFMYSRQLRTGENARLGYLAAGIFSLGAIIRVFHLAQVVLDPEQNFHVTPTAIAEVAYVWLTIAGLFLYGILFLRDGYPRWLGFLMAGLMVLAAALVVIFQGEFFINYPPGIFYLVTMIAGIIIRRQ